MIEFYIRFAKEEHFDCSILRLEEGHTWIFPGNYKLLDVEVL